MVRAAEYAPWNTGIPVVRWLESLAGTLASMAYPSGCRLGFVWKAAGAAIGSALSSGVIEARTAATGKHLLQFDERGEAVRGAFAIRKGRRVDNLRILLLDDVMTSGAMLDACLRALREAGARSVAGLTIARAVRQAIPVRESA